MRRLCRIADGRGGHSAGRTARYGRSACVARLSPRALTRCGGPERDRPSNSGCEVEPPAGKRIRSGRPVPCPGWQKQQDEKQSKNREKGRDALPFFHGQGLGHGGGETASRMASRRRKFSGNPQEKQSSCPVTGWRKRRVPAWRHCPCRRAACRRSNGVGAPP